MKKNLFKKCLFFVGIIISLIIVALIMIRYEKEGEKVLPFSISKIFLVSTVDGKVVDDPANIWNIGVTQVNDIYMYIDKTMDTEILLKEIRLENFILNKEPQKGQVKLLRPTGELSNLYTYSQQNYLTEGISYMGASIDDMKSLEISNDGGVLGFRFSLEELGSYISNEASEITYDGKLLSNLGVNIEEIQFNVTFDVIITTSDDVNYKGTLNLELPIETVIDEGSSNKEITNFDEIIFKRV